MEKDKEKSDDSSDYYGSLRTNLGGKQMDVRKAAAHVGVICLKVALYVAIALGLIYLGQTTYYYSHAVFANQPYEEAPGKNVKVTISEEVGGKELSKVLEENGLIEDSTVFQIQMKMAGFGKMIEANTYELNTSMPPSELIEILSGTSGADET